MISKFVVREKNIKEHLYKGTFKESPFPVIMEQLILPDSDVVVEIPSALNKVTFNKYRNRSVTSAKNINTTICQFMNFVIETVYEGDDEVFNRLKNDGFSGLNLYHLSHFLNYSIDVLDNSHDTIKQKEKRLMDFYKRLTYHRIIDIKWKYKLVLNPETKKKERVHLEPLNSIEYQVRYPDKLRNKVYKENDLTDEEIDLLLLLCSQERFIDIRFAVILGMYGGLRQGEIVNLRFEDIVTYKDKQFMVANIGDRPELFIGRNISGSGVKKPRKQVIFNDNGLLYDFYYHHLEYRLQKMKDKGTNTSALFVDRNGNAMTGYTYIQRFKELKKEFLKCLEREDYSRYDELSQSKWSSHICRGIFTNLCIRRGYARSIYELRNLRGDNSIESSQPYWNKNTIKKITQQCLDVITSCDNYKNELRNLGVKYGL